MTVIAARLGTLIAASSAVELALFLRPPLPVAADPRARLLVDLALQTALLLGVPAALVRWAWKGRLADIGLTWGHLRAWRAGLLTLAAIALPAALLMTRVPAIHAAYPLLAEARTRPLLLVPWTAVMAVYGLAWELFFRGFVTLGLRPALGRWAIAVQAVPCALLHAGKPGLELVASLPGALLLGAIAYRTRSIVPGWLLHLSVALVVNLGAVFWPLAP